MINYIQNEDVIPDTHAFVYKNKKYPFKFDYFKYASKYFSENLKEFEETKTINLLDHESEESMAISDETIENFINFVQSKKIVLNNENVFHLNYLSNKYKVSTLFEKTNEYIVNHKKDLVIDILMQKQEESNFDASTYEDIIAENMENYIEDERLLNLEIPLLYRILTKYKEIQNKPSKKMIDFIFKCIDKHGRNASIFFENFHFGEAGRETMKKLIKEYSNVFDFSFISKNIVEIFDEFEKNQMKCEETISLKENENNEMNKQIKNLQKENEQVKKENEQVKKENNEYSSEIEKQNKIIKQQQEKINDMDKKIQELEIPKSFVPLLYDKNKEFNGIIKYLTDKTGGNIHDNGTIEITANSQQAGYEVKNLLNFNCHFYMSNRDDSQICFDFKKKKLKITNYSIKSNSSSPNIGHLKSWRIEISNDGIKWIKIDEQNNCSTLNGSNFSGTFNVVPNNFSRYVRLSQTEPTWGGGHYLFFDYIEFYGFLEE